MRFIFRYFMSTKTFTKKITELEGKISSLEIKIKALQDAPKTKPVVAQEAAKDIPKEPPKEQKPTIKIEHLQVDKIIIQKMDYANNFGQLGIRDLSGKLNIGTSYEGNIPKQIEEVMEEKIEEKLGKLAKVQFRAKKET